MYHGFLNIMLIKIAIIYMYQNIVYNFDFTNLCFMTHDRQTRVRNGTLFFLFFNQIICCWHSQEPSLNNTVLLSTQSKFFGKKIKKKRSKHYLIWIYTEGL